MTIGILSRATLILSLATSCQHAEDDGARDEIQIAEQNDLQITMLRSERAVQAGNKIYTLKAYRADEQEVAFVRLTTGTIPGLSDTSPGTDDFGAEIVISVRGTEVRIATRETTRFELGPLGRNPAVASFLMLDSVASALEGGANIIVDRAAAAAERPYTVQTCPASHLNTTPAASECCYQYNTAELWTVFRRGPWNDVSIHRKRNPVGPGDPCKAADGVSACSGANCYYGPNGHARALIYGPMSDYLTIIDWGGECGAIFYDNSSCCYYSPFGDVTGTFPTGQGCPGGGGTGAGEWDY